MDGPFPGLKDAILKAEDGGEAEFEVPPKDAFGERNPRNLDYRRYADIARIAQKQEKDVDRGVKLEIDGRIATITLVTPARVRIDYNHELAGKTIKTKVNIIETLTERDDIVKAILDINLGTSEEFEFSEEDGVLSLKVPSAVSLGFEWSTVKLRVVTQLRKHTGIKHIRYIEEFFQRTEVQEEPEINVDADNEGDTVAPAGGDGAEESATEANEDPEATETEDQQEVPAQEDNPEQPEPSVSEEPSEPEQEIPSSESDAAVAEPKEE